jgi:predicted enzyme related to lactoylglutathione lyase
MNRAKAFYEATFDTKLEELPSPGMKMLAFPMRPELPGCAGALVKYEGKPSGDGGTLVYFSCADCATEASKAVKNGGRVFKEKFSIGQYGFIALIFDTEGNMVGLHSLR